MIELSYDDLVFTFYNVHSEARLNISFRRTMRLPDDVKLNAAPPSFNRFPLVDIDGYKDRVPSRWVEQGGIMLPMYQSEALYLSFSSSVDPRRISSYPFAIKVCAGKINALTGLEDHKGLQSPPQNYLVFPKQSWLDGFCIDKGRVRQFVAKKLQFANTDNKQSIETEDLEGLHISVFPMKAGRFEELYPKSDKIVQNNYSNLWGGGSAQPMGIAPGGKIKQEIYRDEFGAQNWDLENGSKCFVHITDAQSWTEITGQNPPQEPFSAERYRQSGLPWLDIYEYELNAMKNSFKRNK